MRGGTCSHKGAKGNVLRPKQNATEEHKVRRLHDFTVVRACLRRRHCDIRVLIWIRRRWMSWIKRKMEEVETEPVGPALVLTDVA